MRLNFLEIGFTWCVVQSFVGPVDPSVRALSGRLKFTVQRHKFNEDSLYPGGSVGNDPRQSL